MNQCQCQTVIDTIKLTAREGIIRELNHQLTMRENKIATLEREIEMLRIELEEALRRPTVARSVA